MEPAGDRPTPGGGTDPGVRPAAAGELAPRVGAALVTGVALVLVLVALSAAGGGTVPAGTFNASNDTGPPTLGNLSTVDETTLTIEVLDDTDVDEDSIDAADFVLTFGTLESANATDEGSNATATLHMDGPIDSDRTSVGVASGATIRDEAGNELRVSQASRQTVTGMDGVAPSIDHFAATNASGSAINLTVGFSEPAKSFVVELSGPDDLALDESDFADTDGYAEYVATVRPDVGGTYDVDVVTVTDYSDNGGPADAEATVTVDVDGPSAVAGIDFAASNGTVFTFDASRTTDASPIRGYAWAFGDGTRDDGVRVTHAFEPGNYTVRLNATDVHGNVGTDELVLNLTDANATVDVAALLADEEVSVTTTGDAGNASALVDVPDAVAGEAVALAPRAGPLASTPAVAVESMTVTLAENRSVRLGVQADGPGAVGDLATNGSVLAGLTVVHDVSDAAVRNVSFTVAVDRTRLGGADDVGLYRHDDGWDALETRALNGTNATARYRANASGLSRFAVVAEPTAPNRTETATPTPTPTPTPTATEAATLVVADASLNATAVAPNATVAVTATVTNRGTESRSYTAGLAVDGRVVETRSVSVPAGGTRTASFAYAPSEPGSYAVAVNGTTAGTLDVGSGASTGGLLGFLPLGLLGTVFTYVGGLLVAVFLVLKALALSLGY